LSVDAICKILASAGPSRMSKLSTKALYVFMTRAPIDSQEMSFAIDYPPYFVYMMLNNLRGGKNPLFQKLYKYPEVLKTVKQFAVDLVQSKLFIDRISR